MSRGRCAQLDMSNVYGRSKSDENLLRAFSGGRLKSQLLLGEEYPPFLQDANVTTAKCAPLTPHPALGTRTLLCASVSKRQL